MSDSVPLDPRTLMSAYAKGLFPMANRTGRIQWYTADPRGIIPLESFHIPGSLRSLVRKSPAEGGFEIRINHNFEATMRGCQDQRTGGTWINDPLIAAYIRLHHLGLAAQHRSLEGRPACRRPLRREPGRRIFRREHVPSHSRRQQGGAGPFGQSFARAQDLNYWTHKPTRRICDDSVASMFRRRNICAG